MPAKSESQRRFMAMCEHSDHPPAKCPDMSKDELHEFSSSVEEKSSIRMTKRDKEDLGNGFRRR